MRKFVTCITVLVVLFSIFVPFITVLADNNECTVTVATTKGNIGDTVYVPVSIENNPGISGITIDITYNSKVLEFVSHTKGPAFTDNFMLKAHPDKNVIKIALVEYSKDSHNNDDILTLKFNISNDAKADFYEIGINYDKGDFANRKLEAVMPVIKKGGVEVLYNPAAKNCPHKNYGEWVTVVKPVCTKGGIDERKCTLCGHNDTKETAATGHIYEEEWTVDAPATKEKDGVMTRHCKHCTHTVDRITFKYEDPQKEDFENNVGAEVPKDDYTENLFEEQNPGEELTGNQNDNIESNTVNSSSNITNSKNESSTKNPTTNSNSSIINNIGNLNSNSTVSDKNSAVSEDTQTSVDSALTNSVPTAAETTVSEAASSNINSANNSKLNNSSVITNDNDTDSEKNENKSPTDTFNNKLILIAVGLIVLVIVIAVIAIILCIKKK